MEHYKAVYAAYIELNNTIGSLDIVLDDLEYIDEACMLHGAIYILKELAENFKEQAYQLSITLDKE